MNLHLKSVERKGQQSVGSGLRAQTERGRLMHGVSTHLCSAGLDKTSLSESRLENVKRCCQRKKAEDGFWCNAAVKWGGTCVPTNFLHSQVCSRPTPSRGPTGDRHALPSALCCRGTRGQGGKQNKKKKNPKTLNCRAASCGNAMGNVKSPWRIWHTFNKVRVQVSSSLRSHISILKSSNLMRLRPGRHWLINILLR